MKFVANGTTPVHLEVWLNGVLQISYDDSAANRRQTGVPGIHTYTTNARFTSFAIY